MFGLILSDPAQDTHRRDAASCCDAASRRDAASRLLHDFDIPLAGFTDVPAPDFTGDESRAAFLRKASAALLVPGRPLPMDALCACLTDGPLPGNVIRRYVFLQLSLLPWLRPGRTVTQGDGFFLLGEDLLVAPVREDDTVDVLLPPGLWTELNGTATHQGRLRAMRGFNELPILVRENVLMPIGVEDRNAGHDDADRLTLHWYQPGETAHCTLADRTSYRAMRREGGFTVQTDTDKPFHLIVHEGTAVHLRR